MDKSKSMLISEVSVNGWSEMREEWVVRKSHTEEVASVGNVYDI